MAAKKRSSGRPKGDAPPAKIRGREHSATGSSHRDPSGAGPGAGPGEAVWLRVAIAAAVGVLAYLLAGALPLPGAWLGRALVAGLVVGLAAREPGDLPYVAGAGAAAALGGVVFAAAGAGADPQALAPDALAYVAGPVVAAAIAAGMSFLCARGWASAAAALSVFIVIGMYLHTTGVLPGEPSRRLASFKAGLAQEPQAEQYGFDGYIFLRINFLTEKGMPYYDAFVKSYEEDSRIDGTPGQLLHIRQRWIYDLWRLLPGSPGIKVWNWFVAMVCVTMAVGYALARRFVTAPAALLAPIALGGYFAMPATSMWFPLADFWVGCVAIWFVHAMVTERWTLAAILAVVAFSFRELAAVLVAVYVAWWVVSHRRWEGVLGLAIALAGPVALFLAHRSWAPVKAQGTSETSFYFQGGFQRLVDALRFSGDLTVAHESLYLLVPVLALAGAVLTRAWWTRVVLAGAVFAPSLLLIAFSSGQWGYYWGAIAQPSFLALAPLAVGWWLPSRLSVLDAPPDPRAADGKVKVVVYARNAAERLDGLVRDTAQALDSSVREHAILVLDDGSTDDTSKVAERLKGDLGVAVQRSTEPQGRAAACGKGVAAALKASKDGDAIVVLDACGCADPADVGKLIDAHARGYDVVVASRLKLGFKGRDGLVSRAAAWVSCWLASSVFRLISPAPGLRDYAATCRLYDVRWLRAANHGSVTLGDGGSDVALVPANRDLGRILEVPAVFSSACAGGGSWGEAPVASLGALLRGRWMALARPVPA